MGEETLGFAAPEERHLLVVLEKVLMGLLVPESLLFCGHLLPGLAAKGLNLCQSALDSRSELCHTSFYLIVCLHFGRTKDRRTRVSSATPTIDRPEGWPDYSTPSLTFTFLAFITLSTCS